MAGSWTSLFDEIDVADAVEVLDLLDEAPEFELGASLGAAVDGALAAAIHHTDPSLEERLVEKVATLLVRAHADRDASTLSGLGMVAASVFLASTGRPVDPARELALWLPTAMRRADTLRDADVVDLALACAALGRDAEALKLVHGSVPRFDPDAAYGPDKPSFVRHLVAAGAAGANMFDVNAAWTSFVADFPAGLETGSVRWSCLQHGGYAVFVRFGDYPPGDVLAATRQFVHDVAAG